MSNPHVATGTYVGLHWGIWHTHYRVFDIRVYQILTIAPYNPQGVVGQSWHWQAHNNVYTIIARDDSWHRQESTHINCNTYIFNTLTPFLLDARVFTGSLFIYLITARFIIVHTTEISLGPLSLLYVCMYVRPHTKEKQRSDHSRLQGNVCSTCVCCHVTCVIELDTWLDRY